MHSTLKVSYLAGVHTWKIHQIDKSTKKIIKTLGNVKTMPCNTLWKPLQCIKFNHQGYKISLSKCAASLNQHLESFRSTSKLSADFSMQNTFKAKIIHENMTTCLFHQHSTWKVLCMEKSMHSPDVNIQLSNCFAWRCQNLGRCRSLGSEIYGKRWEL